MSKGKIIMLAGFGIVGYSAYKYNKNADEKEKNMRRVSMIAGAVLTFIGYAMTGGKD